MTAKEEKFLKTLIVPAIFAGKIYGIWIVTCLWTWFVVPLGVPAIGMLEAAGLTLMLGYLRPRPDDFYELKERKPIEKRWEIEGKRLLLNTTVLGICWLLQGW